MWAFSSGGERGLSLVAVRGDLAAVASLALEHRGSEVVGQGMPDLSFHPGIKPAPLAMEGWSPNWTARENPDYILKMS